MSQERNCWIALFFIVRPEQWQQFSGDFLFGIACATVAVRIAPFVGGGTNAEQIKSGETATQMHNFEMGRGGERDGNASNNNDNQLCVAAIQSRERKECGGQNGSPERSSLLPKRLTDAQ